MSYKCAYCNFDLIIKGRVLICENPECIKSVSKMEKEFEDSTNKMHLFKNSLECRHLDVEKEIESMMNKLLSLQKLRDSYIQIIDEYSEIFEEELK